MKTLLLRLEGDEYTSAACKSLLDFGVCRRVDDNFVIVHANKLEHVGLFIEASAYEGGAIEVCCNRLPSKTVWSADAVPAVVEEMVSAWKEARLRYLYLKDYVHDAEQEQEEQRAKIAKTTARLEELAALLKEVQR